MVRYIHKGSAHTSITDAANVAKRATPRVCAEAPAKESQKVAAEDQDMTTASLASAAVGNLIPKSSVQLFMLSAISVER